MPARLVYAPKSYVYTKRQDGVVYNLSPYVVSGQVQRKVDQVSSAEITLRNPYKRFTTPSQGVAFHPMDPITIYLERVAGFPVRVFTGYLDTTPYYQLYPGTITLQASCTLKRLLYTYFDPSLPYVIAFFTKYGWINTGQGSIISSKAFNSKQVSTQADVNAGKQPFTDLQDGSLAKLLWAILFDIGEWQDSNIYIENLPSGANGIAARMARLMSSMQKAEKQASTDFTLFLHQVIGAGSQGSGGGTGGVTVDLKGKGDVATWAQAILQALGVPTTNDNLKAMIGWANVESGGTWGTGQNDDPQTTHNPINTTQKENGSSLMPGGSAAGVQQYPDWQTGLKAVVDTFTAGSGPSNYGAITSLLKSGHPTASEFANAVASSPWGTSGASLAQAIQAAQVPNNITSTPNDAAAATGETGTGTQTNKTVSNNKVNTNGVINPIPGFTGLTFDDGIDASAPAGSAVLAPAACTVVDWISNFYNPASDGSGGLLLLKFDQTPSGAPCPYWYISEHVIMSSTSTGHHFNQGDTVATFGGQGGGSGIEIGWGDPNASSRRWAQNHGNAGDTHFGSGGSPWGTSFQNFFSVGGGSPQKGGNTGNGGAAGSVSGTGSAEAFVAELQFPSVEDQVTAIALGAEHKGLMHDQSLMPFVQQVAQASMRSFQSLPNGDFFAFYPDYFGEMGHHNPYWMIKDIEILNGGINLSDDALATHVFAVGDNTWPVNNELLNMLFSAGTINVFNAFLGSGIIDKTQSKGDMSSLLNASEAVNFIKRYGARPLVQNYPMVRSPIFEMLLAYQQFLLAWSNQFKTPFTFTFMPELYPGGKVGFPDHGIQMYINSVTHEWNYEEGGFTTSAELSAPALLEGVTNANFPDIPPNMVQAIIEPVKDQAKSPTSSPQAAVQGVANIVDQSVEALTSEIVGGLFGISPGGQNSPH